MPGIDSTMRTKQLPPCCERPACKQRFGTRVYRYEGKRYCSRNCMEAIADKDIGRPVFAAPNLMKFPSAR